MFPRFIRINGVMTARDCCRATVYNDIERELLPRPIRLNDRVNAWLADEIDAVNAAIVAGQSKDEIRQLVRRLEAARSFAVPGAASPMVMTTAASTGPPAKASEAPAAGREAVTASTTVRGRVHDRRTRQ